MDIEIVKKVIIDILVNGMGVDINKVKSTSLIKEEFGFDSLDFMEIIVLIESEYLIFIPDEEIPNLNTIEDFAKFVVKYVDD